MTPQANEMLSTVARELHLSEEDLLKQGLRSVLERQLREVKAEIFAITGRYSVSSVEEMEAAIRMELWKRLTRGVIYSAWTTWSISGTACCSCSRL